MDRGGGTAGINHNDQAGIADVHLFTSSLVNEVRVGYLYNNSTQTGSRYATAHPLQRPLDLPCIPGHAPWISEYLDELLRGNQRHCREFSSFGGVSPEFNDGQTEQLSDNVSWTHGRHSVKWGVDARKSLFEVLLDGLGQSIFGNTFSSSSDTANSGLPLADFLMGYPTVESPGSSTLVKRDASAKLILAHMSRMTGRSPIS